MTAPRQRATGVRESYGIPLFFLTLLVELIGVWPRYLLVRALFWPFSFLTTGLVLFRDLPLVSQRQIVSPIQSSLALSVLTLINSTAEPIARIVAWGPLILSLLTFVFLPGGFLLTRLALGARKPSVREREAIEGVLHELKRVDTTVRTPSAYYVIDNIQPNAYTIGTTLYLHGGLLSETTPAIFRFGVIAHHLGHRNSLDGRLELALRRLVLPPIYFLARSLGTVAPSSFVYSIGRGDPQGCLAGALVLVLSGFLAIAGGGIGTLLLNPLWASYWRTREYVADQFAARLEQSDALIQYLKKYTLSDVATPYALNSVPSNELRIDRLLHGPDTQGTMGLPKRDTTVLVGGLSLVCLAAFLSFGGGKAFFGPRLENSQWLLESFTYHNGTPVTNSYRCQVFFTDDHFTEADCFDNSYAYQRKATYTYLDADTILIEPLEGGNNLAIYFGGTYDLHFTGQQLVMTNTSTGYTLTWRRN
jgi:Zn-dependent protease with chaperone function